MTIHSEEDVRKLVLADSWMMDVLKAAEKLNLPDWWIGAGFLRNKVWDAIEGKKTQRTDVDLVYFDADKAEPEADWAYDEQLNHDYPSAHWEVRNQARMHYVNGFEPYRSAADGISHWIETATCVAVKLEDGKLKFLFCHGPDDLFGLIARPSPCVTTPKLLQLFHDRVEQKKWRQNWPNLRVISKPAD